MSIAEFLNDPKPVGPPQAPATSESTTKLRKQVFVGFGSIAVLGLALAGFYVASRIFSGERTVAPVAATSAAVIKPAVQTAPQVVKPAATPSTASPAPPPMVPVPTVVKPVPVTELKPQPAAKAPAPPPMVLVPTVVKPVTVTEPKPQPTAKAPAPPPMVPVPTVVKLVPVTEPKPAPKVPALLTKAAVSAPVSPKPVPTQAPAASAKRDVPFQRHDLNPHHGERYLQIAAYGPRSLDAYLKVLERQGIHPLVAPGPAENIYRVVIGPFADSNALEQARRSIEAEGIEPILRSY